MCDRHKHLLATLGADIEGLYVDAREVVNHREGFYVREHRYRQAELDEAAVGIYVGCDCGRQFTLDLTSAFENRKLPTPRRIRAKDIPGASLKRRRNAVQD